MSKPGVDPTSGIMENRHGLAVAGMVTHANGTAERRASEIMLKAKSKAAGRRITAGEDKAYDTANHVANLRARNVTPHVTQNNSVTKTGRNRESAIDGRTTRHEGYGISQSRRANGLIPRAIYRLGAPTHRYSGHSSEKLPPASAPAPARPDADAAERRQVTVMFCDLVGSTALSARMDPEDLREVISVYQKCVAEAVRRFGGFVAKYMGDGVLVYFGYPQAHEDDAERAVRAGLELIAAVAGLKTHASLQTRVGIATGLVVVGDLIGSGEAQERGIVGETPNLERISAGLNRDLPIPRNV
jgi:hypothetical protein